MKDPREDKLPKWAKALLSAERYRADKAERRLAEHLDKVEPTPIWYGDYDNPIYIPEHYGYQTVHFQFGSSDLYDDINVRKRDDGIEVGGGRALSIDMEVSNRFKIRFRD